MLECLKHDTVHHPVFLFVCLFVCFFTATKADGFALYFLGECNNVSILSSG